MSTIGERIQQLRLRRGLSQSELAEAIGETKQTLYKYEHGVVTNIPISKIEAIAKALRCPPSVLTGWEEEDPQDGQSKRVKEEDDAELLEYLEYLRTRPEARILMSTMRGATKEEVEENVRFIEALRKSRRES